MRTEKIAGGIIALLFLLGVGLIAWQVFSNADEDSPAAMQAEAPGPAGRGDEFPAVMASGDGPTAAGASQAGPSHIRIYGTVTERRGGAPIAGAEVRLQQARPGTFGGAMTPPGQAIRQRGDTGAFAIAETTDRGGYSIEMEWAGGDDPLPQLVLACLSGSHAPHEETVPIHGRSELRMDIQLQRAAGVSGRVVRADARGTGVEGVQVMAGQGGEWMWGGQSENTATTSENGAFALTHLSPGRYSLGLSGLQEHGLYFPAGSQTVYVDEGARVEGVELEVEEGGRITGRVTDQRGGPVTEAWVELTPTRFSTSAMETLMLARDARGETDEDGVYSIAGLPPEGEFSVGAQAVDYAPSSRKTVTLTERARVATADFVLGEGSTISGHIVHADGEPFAEGGVQLARLDMQAFDMEGLGRLTQTGEDGSFTLEHVAPGRYTVTAGWMSVETEDGDPATLTVEDGRDIQGLRFVLASRDFGDWPEPEGVITGRVYDSRGNPVEDAAVTASMGAFPAQTVSSTAGGVFTIENLWQGNYTVEAQARGEVARREGVPLHADIRLNLSPGARIEGLVIDSEGGPAEGVMVTLVNLDEQDAEGELQALVSHFQDVFAEGRHRSDASGFFEFGDLHPGRYQVQARDATQGTGESDVIALTRGQTRSGLQVRLERGVRVTGRVQDPSGRAVSGAQVRLARATDNIMAQAMESAIPAGMGGVGGHSATTNRQGEFEIVNVPPGSYDLVATHRSYARNRLPGVTVRRGADTHGLRVVMSVGGGVRGRLTDSSGEPASGGVFLLGPGGFHMVTAGSQGEFSVGGVASGSYLAIPMDMTEMAAGGGSQAFPEMGVVDVTDGQEANLDFGPAGDIPVSGRISNHEGGETVVSVRRPGGPHPSEMSMSQIGTTLDILRHQAGQAVVQPDGSFHIEGLEPGEYIVDVLRFDEQAAIRDPMNFRMESLYGGPLSVGDSGSVDLDIALP